MNYALMVWRGAWVEKRRGATPWEVRRGEDGLPGDDWTVRCLRCGKDSMFYGCAPCDRTALQVSEGSDR